MVGFPQNPMCVRCFPDAIGYMDGGELDTGYPLPARPNSIKLFLERCEADLEKLDALIKNPIENPEITFSFRDIIQGVSTYFENYIHKRPGLPASWPNEIVQMLEVCEEREMREPLPKSLDHLAGFAQMHLIPVLEWAKEHAPNVVTPLPELSTSKQLATHLGETEGAIKGRLARIRRDNDGCYIEPARDGFARRGDGFLHRTEIVLPLLKKRRKKT